MGGAIGPNDASPVQHEGDGQVLDAHVVDQLVVGALQEGAVDRHHGPESFAGHAGGHGDGVLFGDAHVKVLIGEGLLEQIQARAGGHGGGDAHHAGIVFADLHQRLAKHLAPAGRLGLAGGVGLARGQVEGALGVVADLVGLGVGIALALGGGHVHQNRAFVAVGCLKGAHHGSDVMAVDRAHVGEAQLFKNGPQLGHRQPLHALLEGLELGGQLPVQKREMADRLLGVVLDELHRLAEPHAVEVGGEGADRRADRHVVVVQHHQQIGARQMTGMVDRLQRHAAREGPITNHGNAFELFLAGITGEGHPQGGRDARGGVPRAEMVEAALRALEIAGYTTLLAQRVEIAVTAGD